MGQCAVNGSMTDLGVGEWVVRGWFDFGEGHLGFKAYHMAYAMLITSPLAKSLHMMRVLGAHTSQDPLFIGCQFPYGLHTLQAVYPSRWASLLEIEYLL